MGIKHTDQAYYAACECHRYEIPMPIWSQDVGRETLWLPHVTKKIFPGLMLVETIKVDLDGSWAGFPRFVTPTQFKARLVVNDYYAVVEKRNGVLVIGRWTGRLAPRAQPTTTMVVL